MKRFSPLLALLLATTAGCSQAGHDGNGTNATPTPAPRTNASNVSASANASTSASEANAIPPELPAPRSSQADQGTAPAVDPNLAPGIAFDYRYAFRLEADRIAGMQREHQELCARYGPRCQVTGIDYRAVNDEDVEASLSFSVDSAIADQFGRESVRAVTAADGELTESGVNGTDVGTPLKANTGQLEDLQAELDRIQARLALPNLPRGERAQLNEQRQSLRQQISALDEETGEQEHRLATVPIQFRYGSGTLAPGPGHGPTVGQATARAAGNFLGALRTILILFVSISPWALTGLLGWLGFRAWRKRRPANPPAPTEA